MSFKVLLLLQLTLLTIYGSPCQKDDDCPSYMGCYHNQCALCDKLSVRCGDDDSWPCCGNNTCQVVTYLNASMCFPESCTQHSDCGGGFGCKNRTGKCDLCYKENDLCIGKPGERLECCNGECDPVTGMCQIREDVTEGYKYSIDVVDVNGTVVISNNHLTSNGIDLKNTTCKSKGDCLQEFGCLFRTGKCGLCHPIGERCTLPYDSLECCSSYCRIGVNADGSGVCADPRQFQPETATRSFFVMGFPPRAKGPILRRTNTNTDTTTTTGRTITSTPSIWNEHLVSLMEPFMTDRGCTSYFNCGPNQDCLVKHNKCVTCQRHGTECNENSDCCTKNCRQTVILGYGVQMRCGLLAYV